MDSKEERGARLRSVGVLCRDYRALVQHYFFLSDTAQKLNENPGDFTDLDKYIAKNQDNGGSQNALAQTAAYLFKPLADIYVDEVSANVGSLSASLHH